MTARIYLRVSTMRQSDGASLEVQRAACYAYVTTHGIPFGSEHLDILSGTRDDRPAYNEMLAALRPGDMCIVWRLDRVGRKKSELFRFFEHCKQQHIGIVSVTQPEMSNELARDILSVIAAFESQQIAERVLPSMIQRAEAGRWMAREPLGYRLPRDHEPDYAGGHLVPSDDAERVRAIFAHYLLTGNYDAVASRFDLDRGRVRKMLVSRTYIGETHWRGITTPGTHPPLIDAAEFAAVQERIAGRRRAGRRYHAGTALLTGLLYAEDTPARLYYNARHTGGTPHYTMRATAYGISCSIAAPYAERCVLDDLRSMTLSPAVRRAYERDLVRVSRHDPHKRARDALMRDRAKLRDAADRAASAHARGLIDDLSLAAVQREQARERQRLDAEERALPAIPDLARATPVLALRVGLLSAVNDCERRGDVEGLRRLVEALFARVEAWDCRRTGDVGWTRKKTMEAHPPRVICRPIFEQL